MKAQNALVYCIDLRLLVGSSLSLFPWPTCERFAFKEYIMLSLQISNFQEWGLPVWGSLENGWVAATCPFSAVGWDETLQPSGQSLWRLSRVQHLSNVYLKVPRIIAEQGGFITVALKSWHAVTHPGVVKVNLPLAKIIGLDPCSLILQSTKNLGDNWTKDLIGSSNLITVLWISVKACKFTVAQRLVFFIQENNINLVLHYNAQLCKKSRTSRNRG